MSEELLEVMEEVATEEAIEGVTDALETVDDTLEFEIDVDGIEDILITHYTKGAIHATTAIGVGVGMFKLFKNRNKIKDTVTTFVNKNKEAINEMKKKSDKPKVVEAEVIESE